MMWVSNSWQTSLGLVLFLNTTIADANNCAKILAYFYRTATYHNIRNHVDYSRMQKAAKIAQKMGGDLMWVNLPYLARPFLEAKRNGADGKENFDAFVRTGIFSTALILAGAHPLLILSEHEEDEISKKKTIRGSSLISSIDTHEGVNYQGRNVIVLMADDVFKDFYGSKKANIFKTSEFKHIKSQSKSTDVKIYNTPDEFVEMFNAVGSETDTLILMNHGVPDNFQGFNVRDRIPDLKHKPLAKDGNLLFFVCDAGECSDQDMKQEYWIQMADLKLPISGGKAIAATAPISKNISGARPVYFLYQRVKVAATQPLGSLNGLVGITYLKKSLEDIRPEQQYPVGFRVYDKDKNETRFYQYDAKSDSAKLISTINPNDISEQ